MINRPAILPENLAADHRGVGSSIVVDSVVGAAGAPTDSPPTTAKIWQWWDTAANQITHLWSPVLGQWVLLSGTSLPAPSLYITNTDVTTNIAPSGEQAFSEAFGVIQRNIGGFGVNPGAAQATLPIDGRYQVNAYWGMLGGIGSNASRNNIRIFFRLDGIVISPFFQNNYLRDGTSHNEVGQGISGFEFEATAGQTLQLLRERMSGTGGTQTLAGTNNYLSIRKL